MVFTCSLSFNASSLFQYFSFSSSFIDSLLFVRYWKSSFCFSCNSTAYSEFSIDFFCCLQSCTLFYASFLFIFEFPSSVCQMLVIHRSISLMSVFTLSARSLLGFLLSNSSSCSAVWQLFQNRISEPIFFIQIQQTASKYQKAVQCPPLSLGLLLVLVIGNQVSWREGVAIVGEGGGNIFYITQSFFVFSHKMQANQEQTPYPQLMEQAIIEQVLRLSLEHENKKTFSTGNGLPHRYRKLIKNMKMGKSKQKCTICIEGFAVDEPIKRLPCGHIFHSLCAKNWLQINRRCPVCRLDLELHFQALERPLQPTITIEQ